MLGCIVGFLSCFWMKKLLKDLVLAINITLFSSYTVNPLYLNLDLLHRPILASRVRFWRNGHRRVWNLPRCVQQTDANRRTRRGHNNFLEIFSFFHRNSDIFVFRNYRGSINNENGGPWHNKLLRVLLRFLRENRVLIHFFSRSKNYLKHYFCDLAELLRNELQLRRGKPSLLISSISRWV